MQLNGLISTLPKELKLLIGAFTINLWRIVFFMERNPLDEIFGHVFGCSHDTYFYIIIFNHSVSINKN